MLTVPDNFRGELAIVVDDVVGSTHGIHHFYVPDPFYLRQMTAAAAHRVMRANGVRFNDLGSFARANRYAG